MKLECDLHGFELSEAIIEVFQTLEECVVNEDRILEIVHGYSRGTVLRSYFRSKRFLRDAAREGYVLRIVKSPNPGKTQFHILQKNPK